MKISIEEKNQLFSTCFPAAAGPIPALRRQLLPTPALRCSSRTDRPGQNNPKTMLHNGILLGATLAQELAIYSRSILWLMYQVLCGVGLEYVIMQNSRSG